MSANDKFVGTTQEFADRIGVEYLTAAGALRFLKELGIAHEAGKRKTATGRGKPSTVYSVPLTVTLNLGERVDKAA
jgi:hypothetical protein